MSDRRPPSDEMCPNPVTCPFVDTTEPHPVSDHPGGSDRRPEKLYKLTLDGEGGGDVATIDDVLAYVRRGVESGTIKGEVVRSCRDERGFRYLPLGDPEVQQPGFYAVIPVRHEADDE